MASISSAGKFDSADLNAKVGALSALARPTNEGQLASTAVTANVEARISSAARLQNIVAAVNDAASTLMRPATWKATQASSSDESALVAQSDSSASQKEHAVTVDGIAMAQVTSSAIFSSVATVIGLGTMNIEMGSWNMSQTAFTTNPNWPKASVVFGPRDNSLDRIRDKINAAGVGVIATVMSDATGSRLVLRSTSSGAANGFKVSTTPTPGVAESGDPTAAQLAMLQFDPSSLAAGNGMSLVQPGQNAKLTVDGQAFESDSNTITDAIPGVSLTLREPTDGPVTVRVDQDTGHILRAVKDFAQAYNDLRRQLDPSTGDQQDSAKPPATATRGAIDLVPTSTTSGSASVPAALADVGLSITRSGQLEVNESRLAEALAQRPETVRNRLTEAQAGAPEGVLRPLLQQLSASLPTETAALQPKQKLLEQYQPGMTDARPGLLRSPA